MDSLKKEFYNDDFNNFFNVSKIPYNLEDIKRILKNKYKTFNDNSVYLPKKDIKFFGVKSTEYYCRFGIKIRLSLLINYIIKKYKLKHINDVSKFSNKLFETSKLKFYLGNLLMEHYFSSRKVNKILKQKINTVPFNDKKEKYEFKQLLKKVNNKLSLNEI